MVGDAPHPFRPHRHALPRLLLRHPAQAPGGRPRRPGGAAAGGDRGRGTGQAQRLPRRVRPVDGRRRLAVPGGPGGRREARLAARRARPRDRGRDRGVGPRGRPRGRRPARDARPARLHPRPADSASRCSSRRAPWGHAACGGAHGAGQRRPRGPRGPRTRAGPGPGAGQGGERLRVGRPLLRPRAHRRLRHARPAGARARDVGRGQRRRAGGDRTGRRDAGGRRAAGRVRALRPVPAGPLPPLPRHRVLRDPADRRLLRRVRRGARPPRAPGARLALRRGRRPDRAAVGGAARRVEGRHRAGHPGAGQRGRAGRAARACRSRSRAGRRRWWSPT